MAKLFSYTDYDRISDDIYFLGGGGKLILRMHVGLGKKMTDGTRRHYYHEYSYDSKYNDVGQVVSMRRSYDYYMTLESMDDKLSAVMIRPQDMILLRSRLSDILNWFSGSVFGMKKGRLIINGRPTTIKIDGFPDKKSISFDPVVIDWEDETQSMGIRITLTDSTFSDVTIDKFYGFVYIINSMNMIESAQLMLAYMGMPEYGTNRYEVDTGYTLNKEIVEPNNVIKERQFKPKGGKSYFDRIDNM